MSFISLTNLIYPVGAIYQSTASTSPASLFGGSWSQITSRFLYATTSSNGTGGSNSHTLAESEMPSHSHRCTYRLGWTDTTGGGITAAWQSSGANMRVDSGTYSDSTRAGGAAPTTTCLPTILVTVGGGLPKAGVAQ